MITASLHAYVDRVLEARRITDADVRLLRGDVLTQGITSREEADVLIALDRAIVETDPLWASYLVAAVVTFVVWGSKPAGYVDQDTARWLMTSLSCGGGPTTTARRIAFETVREAQRVDEELLTFVMRDSTRSRVTQPRLAA